MFSAAFKLYVHLMNIFISSIYHATNKIYLDVVIIVVNINITKYFS